MNGATKGEGDRPVVPDEAPGSPTAAVPAEGSDRRARAEPVDVPDASGTPEPAATTSPPEATASGPEADAPTGETPACDAEPAAGPEEADTAVSTGTAPQADREEASAADASSGGATAAPADQPSEPRTTKPSPHGDLTVASAVADRGEVPEPTTAGDAAAPASPSDDAELPGAAETAPGPDAPEPPAWGEPPEPATAAEPHHGPDSPATVDGDERPRTPAVDAREESEAQRGELPSAPAAEVSTPPAALPVKVVAELPDDLTGKEADGACEGEAFPKAPHAAAPSVPAAALAAPASPGMPPEGPDAPEHPAWDEPPEPATAAERNDAPDPPAAAGSADRPPTPATDARDESEAQFGELPSAPAPEDSPPSAALPVKVVAELPDDLAGTEADAVSESGAPPEPPDSAAFTDPSPASAAPASPEVPPEGPDAPASAAAAVSTRFGAARRFLRRFRTWLALTGIAIIAAAVAGTGVYFLLPLDRPPADASRLEGRNERLVRDPEGIVSPEYERSLNLRDAERLGDALDSGGTHFPDTRSQSLAQPMPVAALPAADPPLASVARPDAAAALLDERTAPELPPGVALPGEAAAEEAEAPPAGPLDSLEQGAAEIEGLRDATGEPPIPPGGSDPPPPTALPGRRGGGASDLGGYAEALIASWTRTPDFVRTAPRRDDPAPEAASSPDTANTPPAAPGPAPLLPAGTDLYARLLYAVRSDIAAPAIAEILEPPLRGAVATGSFTEARGGLALRFTRLQHAGQIHAIDAWGVSPDASGFVLPARTERHWVSRLLLPAAVAFASGYLRAAGAPAVSIAVDGATEIRQEARDQRQRIYEAGASGLDAAGRILLEDAPARATRHLDAGTELAIVFPGTSGSQPASGAAPAAGTTP